MVKLTYKNMTYGLTAVLVALILGIVWVNWAAYKREGFEDAKDAPTKEAPASATPAAEIPILKDVWIINLDKSKERWNLMMEEVKVLDPLPVNRWGGTDGRKMTEQEMIDEKIPIIIRPQNTVDFRQERRKGEIGCYLSHKKLLENLKEMKKVSDDAGHLILEDDVTIDKDTLDKWREVAPKLDKDWDIFFFGIHDPQLEEPKDGISRVKSIQSLHAYMVRHASIPKILDVIKIMYDPIDEMIRWNSDKLRLYAIQPFKIHQRSNFHSDIQNKVT